MRRLLVAVLTLAATAAPARAQLISPGKLSQPHAELEGLRSCTNCHQLGRKGASSTKCTECHTPIDSRVRQGRGLHARLEGECSSCHKEHFGREFDLVRLDTASFDHGRTGFSLDGAHRQTVCNACHSASNIVAADVREWQGEHSAARGTLLGLGTTCVGCHESDDPHAGQFKQGCDTCHDSDDWKEPDGFDHRRTKYPLTGRHIDVACNGCHQQQRAAGRIFTRFADTPGGTCTTCHRDQHAGAMGTNCTTCHDTGGWLGADPGAVANRFDHSRTRFQLRGQHADVVCAACHSTQAQPEGIRLRFARPVRGQSFPRPASNSCTACHIDYHQAAFGASEADVECKQCHTESGWMPTSFDIQVHNQRASFELTGAHMAVPCSSCHDRQDDSGRPVFHFASSTCETCHEADSPHGPAFDGRACSSCHTTATFAVDTFDHQVVATDSCRTCHAPDGPHGDQFGADDCGTCHTTDAFVIVGFDHSRTRFQIDGAHVQLVCGACHNAAPERSGTIVRYRDLPRDCADCHGGAS